MNHIPMESGTIAVTTTNTRDARSPIEEHQSNPTDQSNLSHHKPKSNKIIPIIANTSDLPCLKSIPGYEFEIAAIKCTCN